MPCFFLGLALAVIDFVMKNIKVLRFNLRRVVHQLIEILLNVV